MLKACFTDEENPQQINLLPAGLTLSVASHVCVDNQKLAVKKKNKWNFYLSELDKPCHEDKRLHSGSSVFCWHL